MIFIRIKVLQILPKKLKVIIMFRKEYNSIEFRVVLNSKIKKSD